MRLGEYRIVKNTELVPFSLFSEQNRSYYRKKVISHAASKLLKFTKTLRFKCAAASPEERLYALSHTHRPHDRLRSMRRGTPPARMV
jgi:hypothetical protein